MHNCLGIAVCMVLYGDLGFLVLYKGSPWLHMTLWGQNQSTWDHISLCLLNLEGLRIYYRAWGRCRRTQLSEIVRWGLGVEYQFGKWSTLKIFPVVPQNALWVFCRIWLSLVRVILLSFHDIAKWESFWILIYSAFSKCYIQFYSWCTPRSA